MTEESSDNILRFFSRCTPSERLSGKTMSKRNNKYYQTLFLLLALLTAYSLQLNATVRYVSKTGNSTSPYLTWDTAADSIQKCIDICVFGDTIYVANGVYEERVVMISG